MGKSLTDSQRADVVTWAEARDFPQSSLCERLSPSNIRTSFDYELKQYFRLCVIARSKSAEPSIAYSAEKAIFRTRVAIERRINDAIKKQSSSWEDKLKDLTKSTIFGASKKQGVSIRMPLSTCNPTSLCAGGCYAHDVLDASPNAVVRGAINGFIAQEYETADALKSQLILEFLRPHIVRAIAKAKNELKVLPEGFSRRPNIRFSHVGEIVFYPNFANALAKQVRELSGGHVDCVVYTRLKKAKELDGSLWIINFTLDPVSMERRSWAPPESRIVFSAFGGETSPVADVNFLEHHRHSHSKTTKGSGRVCPATAPDAPSRTCDGCLCNRCFVKP
jgi:hypothetical protein